MAQILDPGDLLSEFTPVKPARVSFTDNKAREFSGYFFDQDGVTTKEVRFTVYPSSLSIWMDWHGPSIKGSSGSPLMTSDHKLVGIMLGSLSSDGNVSHIRAIRIDMATPPYIANFIEWDNV